MIGLHTDPHLTSKTLAYVPRPLSADRQFHKLAPPHQVSDGIRERRSGMRNRSAPHLRGSRGDPTVEDHCPFCSMVQAISNNSTLPHLGQTYACNIRGGPWALGMMSGSDCASPTRQVGHTCSGTGATGGDGASSGRGARRTGSWQNGQTVYDASRTVPHFGQMRSPTRDRECFDLDSRFSP